MVTQLLLARCFQPIQIRWSLHPIQRPVNYHLNRVTSQLTSAVTNGPCRAAISTQHDATPLIVYMHAYLPKQNRNDEKQVVWAFAIRRFSETRNVLDCDQSNYSSRIITSSIVQRVFVKLLTYLLTCSYTFTLEPSTSWIGWTVSEKWPFEIFQYARSVVGRSVGPQYIHWCHEVIVVAASGYLYGAMKTKVTVRYAYSTSLR